ncbi:unnamed protein product, partial [Colletotrichum noveboracense]
MLQEKHTINFSSKHAGSTQAKPSNSFFPKFFLNFLTATAPYLTTSLYLSRDRHSYTERNISAGYLLISLGRPSGSPRQQRVRSSSSLYILYPAKSPSFYAQQPTANRGKSRQARRAGYPQPRPKSWQLTSQVYSAQQSCSARASSPAGVQGASTANRSAPANRPSSRTTFHTYNYSANIQINISPQLYHLPHKKHYSHNNNNKEEDNRDSRGQGSKDETQRGIEGLFINNKSNKLHSCFRLENITAVSYALTIYINSKSEARLQYLLINCNIIAREYLSSYNFTFYPQAFYLVYRNISSSQPPTFLNSLFAAMKRNMSDQNEGANILSFSYF